MTVLNPKKFKLIKDFIFVTNPNAVHVIVAAADGKREMTISMRDRLDSREELIARTRQFFATPNDQIEEEEKNWWKDIQGKLGAEGKAQIVRTDSDDIILEKLKFVGIE